MAKKNNAKATFADVAPSKWPGERLGLPQKGPLSIARLGRRFGAIVFDWFTANLLSFGLARYIYDAQTLEELVQVMPNITFFAFIGLQIVFIPTIGGSIGHRVFGMRVINLKGGWVGVWRPIVRTVLLALVVPLLVWDSDQRAFHDKIPGTALVRS